MRREKGRYMGGKGEEKVWRKEGGGREKWVRERNGEVLDESEGL